MDQYLAKVVCLDQPPTRLRSQMQRTACSHKDAELCKLIGLIQYQDAIAPSPSMTITSTNVFYDTPNSTQAWIMPCRDELDPLEMPFHHLFLTISSLVDYIDILEHHKSILTLTNEAAFFSSCYRRLDPSTLLYVYLDPSL